MSNENKQFTASNSIEEIIPKAANGFFMLFVILALLLGGIALFVWGVARALVSMAILGGIIGFLLAPLLLFGLKILKPQEALVLTLFGAYFGTLKGPGFFFVNPFVSAIPQPALDTSTGSMAAEPAVTAAKALDVSLAAFPKKKISLKTMTLNNDKQKINDSLGNPIIIGIVVIWRVVNTAKAMFNVDNYTEFLSIQCDSALRNIVRLYPYDITRDDSDNEKSLRSSSQEVSDKLKNEIQSKVEIAGLEIAEARITHLAYAPEIASAMLQRQQASAVIDARQLIVEGAVSMVEMALSQLSEREIVNLDEERKAAMVSNLLVVLCGNKDAQPIVNSGSLY